MWGLRGLSGVIRVAGIIGGHRGVDMPLSRSSPLMEAANQCIRLLETKDEMIDGVQSICALAKVSVKRTITGTLEFQCLQGSVSLTTRTAALAALNMFSTIHSNHIVAHPSIAGRLID